MQHWEIPSEAREIRTRVEALIDRHDIAPTPVNYTLWFFYALGRDAELIAALDAAVAAGRGNDGSLAKDLHDRFCDHGVRAELNASSLRLEEELKKIAAVLEVTGKGSNAYTKTLDSAAEQLEQSEVPAPIKSLIANVAVATQQMAEKNRALEAQVDASSKEVDTLRSRMEMIRKESLVDALTGLANRRAFEEQIAMTIEEAKTEETPFSVLMCDIDHFKKFNDTWGHATGDQVLRLVAQCLRANVKGRDTAARYGGEELVIVLPKTPLAAAMTVAEQIRQAVASRKIVIKSTGETLGQVTLSIGGAEYRSGETATDVVSRADACLYAAKRSGRNRVCSNVDGEPKPAPAAQTVKKAR